MKLKLGGSFGLMYLENKQRRIAVFGSSGRNSETKGKKKGKHLS